MKYITILLLGAMLIGCDNKNKTLNQYQQQDNYTIEEVINLAQNEPNYKPTYKPYNNPFDVHWRTKRWQTYYNH